MFIIVKKSKSDIDLLKSFIEKQKSFSKIEPTEGSLYKMWLTDKGEQLKVKDLVILDKCREKDNAFPCVVTNVLYGLYWGGSAKLLTIDKQILSLDEDYRDGHSIDEWNGDFCNILAVYRLT